MVTNNKSDAVLLCSGGLDSTTLAFLLKSEGTIFTPLFVNYGQHCMETEFETLKEVLPEEYQSQIVKVNVADIYSGASSRLIKEPNLWEDNVTSKDFYLPYRNLLLLTIGSAYAQGHGCSFVYSAFINSNHAKEIDCSAQFFDNLGSLLSDFGGVQIKMPFRNKTKYQVAKLGISLKAPIGLTFSCQASSKIPCGACPNCVDRLEAIRLINEE